MYLVETKTDGLRICQTIEEVDRLLIEWDVVGAVVHPEDLSGNQLVEIPDFAAARARYIEGKLASIQAIFGGACE